MSVTISTGQRPGSDDKPTQDRIFVIDRAVVMLDGASSWTPQERDGAWHAQQLGSRISDRLTDEPIADLRNVVAEAISDLAHSYRLRPGNAPSSTVLIARWVGPRIEVLTLGDSTGIVFTREGDAARVYDERLDRIAAQERQAIRAHSRGYNSIHNGLMMELQAAQRAERNKVGGYWIAEAEAHAAHHAVVQEWQRNQVDAILLMTDGVAHGIDRYGDPASWHSAREIATARGLQALVDHVHVVEETDPDGIRWRRSKRHDDKAAALITFGSSSLLTADKPAVTYRAC